MNYQNADINLTGNSQHNTSGTYWLSGFPISGIGFKEYEIVTRFANAHLSEREREARECFAYELSDFTSRYPAPNFSARGRAKSNTAPRIPISNPRPLSIHQGTFSGSIGSEGGSKQIIN